MRYSFYPNFSCGCVLFSFSPWLIIRSITCHCSSVCCRSVSPFSNSFGTLSLIPGSSSLITSIFHYLVPFNCIHHCFLDPSHRTSGLLQLSGLLLLSVRHECPLSPVDNSKGSSFLPLVDVWVFEYPPGFVFQNHSRSWNSLCRLFGSFNHNFSTTFIINHVGAFYHRNQFGSAFLFVPSFYA